MSSDVQSTHATDEYLLGHDAAELERLEHQAAALAPATTALLTMAGIEPGMRVLDLGTGTGDVAFLTAELVGPHGSVVGIDRSPEPLTRARARATSRGATNVTFTTGDVRDYRDSEPFDAVVGRLVLLYTPDPAAVIRHHAAAMRSDGVLLAIEYDMPAARTVPTVPMTSATVRCVVDAIERSGLDPVLGPRLGAVLHTAGCGDVNIVGIQPYLPPGAGARMLAGIVRTMLPVIERTGVATAADIDVATLEARLANELGAHEALFVPPTLVGAWSRHVSS